MSTLDLYQEQIDAIVKTGIFKDREEFLRTAIETLFLVKPNLKREIAIELYKTGKVTLGRAAEIAHLNRWQFQELLADRGIEVTIEVDSARELDAQIKGFKGPINDSRG